MQSAATPATQIQDVLSKLERALAEGDLDQALNLFADDQCFWRDILTFTWNIKTFEGKSAIRQMLEDRLAGAHPESWKVIDEELTSDVNGGPEGFIQFETAIAHGNGYIRLKDGRIWTLLTAMKDLKGHEFKRPFGARHYAEQGGPSWTEERAAEAAEIGVTRQPYVLIIGAGQNGVMLGARLRQMNVPTLIVEKLERPGDSWRNRYRTLCLHNPVWENSFPFMDLPENWPVFAPKDKFADWLEAYAKLMDLNVWGNTEAKRCTYDDKSHTWTVLLERNGKQLTLNPKHLVLATGDSGTRPNVPNIPGQGVFEGVQQHSAQLYELDDMRGKKVVIVGSGTSAHDICGDLAQNGIDVTMIQRSSSYVVKSESFAKHILGPVFSAEAVARGIDAKRADILGASIPLALFFGFQKRGVDKIREVDADFYKALADTGFLLDYGPQDSGLFGKAITGVFNYYIEIGTSQLIIDGKVKVASGSGVKKLTKSSVVLDDGREIPADVVIYATGFGFMEGWVADLISEDVANKIGLVGGFGSGGPKDPGPWEGDLRNMWKPTQQEGLWIQSALIPAARSYSHYLALQLKARWEGIPTPVYGVPKATPIASSQRPSCRGLSADFSALKPRGPAAAQAQETVHAG